MLMMVKKAHEIISNEYLHSYPAENHIPPCRVFVFGFIPFVQGFQSTQLTRSLQFHVDETAMRRILRSSPTMAKQRYSETIIMKSKAAGIHQGLTMLRSLG